jgi:hypothetical protein
MSKPPTCFEAITNFIGQIAAGYARVLDEGDPEAECTISFYGYTTKMKLGDLQALDRAHAAESERREKAAERKFNKDNLFSRMKGDAE